MALSGAAALLCAVLLFASAIRFGKPAPFAMAARHISRRPPPAEAWRQLHRAFDATAGRRVLAQDVESFLAGHPAFAPLRADIDDFFAASSNFFFGTAAQPIRDWEKLARALARAERRA